MTNESGTCVPCSGTGLRDQDTLCPTCNGSGGVSEVKASKAQAKPVAAATEGN